AETIKRFRRIYHWPAPKILKDSAFGAKLACFEDTPVILAAPPAGGGWLSERITRFGETPVAFLLKTRDFKAACKGFDVKPSSTWFGRRVAWFDREKLNGTRMAVIDGKSGP
ncbi:MAG: hypothetical protein O7F76_10705, partial [Planctomycetota bacterium]|nr:hypothetical protein [Planctomycetota bacterium]